MLKTLIILLFSSDMGYSVVELGKLAASAHHEGVVADVLRAQPLPLAGWLPTLPAGPQCLLWLDGVEKKYVEEVGSMNIMFKIDGKVYTAATVGTVLPGVTRRSCIELLKDWGYDVIEGKLAIADIMQAAREGKLEEVFGTGTAAVVSPVKELVWKGEHAFIGDGKIGPVTQKLYDTMTGMQWGKIPDTKGWIVPVEKKY